MLNFKELINEEPAFRAYHALVGTLAFKNELPIKVIRVDKDKKSTFVFITKKAESVKTCKAVVSTVEAPFFTSWIGADFPEVDFERIDID